MAEQDALDYDALEAHLTHPDETLSEPRRVLTGEAAAAFGRELLLCEFGSDDAIAEAMRRGRPSVGSAKRGPSPVVRGVISPDDFEAFKQLERTTGLRQSELVRKAVHQLLVAEKLVS